MARPVGRRGETRDRVVAAAVELFAEHGVAGTSLQMIADRLGVTKAAVYFQFSAKDDIVLAVVQPALDQVGALADRAEQEPDPVRRRTLLVEGLVDVVLDHREVMAVIQSDPGIASVLRRGPAEPTVGRIEAALLGPEPDLAALVAGSIFGGGLMLTGADPRLQAMDRTALRDELLAAARRLLPPPVTG